MTERCRSCGGLLREHLPHVVDPQSGEAFRIDRCSSCELGHTLPRPVDVSKYYGPAYHGNRHSFTARYCSARRVRLLESTSGGRAGRLLDVGCGDGTFLLAAKARGWDVRGTELNPSRAQAEGLDVRARVDDFEPTLRFDRITFWHTLEHMENPLAVINSVSQRLEPHGQLLIAVPDADGLQARAFGAGWFHLDVPRHLFHFNARALEHLLERTGFEVLRRWHQELEYDVMGWAQSVLNRASHPPNLFFSTLTGRKPAVSSVRRSVHVATGLALSAAALPVTWMGTALHRGGTLIVQARHAPRGATDA